MKIKTKKSLSITFRPDADVVFMVAQEMQRLGKNSKGMRSKILNEGLRCGLQNAGAILDAAKKAGNDEEKKLREMLLYPHLQEEMVRDAGIEPATPTVSTESSGIKFADYAISQAPLLPKHIAHKVTNGINVGSDLHKLSTAQPSECRRRKQHAQNRR